MLPHFRSNMRHHLTVLSENVSNYIMHASTWKNMSHLAVLGLLRHLEHFCRSIFHKMDAGGVRKFKLLVSWGMILGQNIVALVNC